MAKYLSEAGLAHLWTNILKPLFSSKVDKVTGKGLSSLDFTQAYLNRIGAAEDAVTTLGSTKVDKVTGKGLSTNDFTTAYKDLVDQNAADIAEKSIPNGGTTRQALVKSSATDYATEWAAVQLQYEVMPTEAVEILGLIAQYIGTTNDDFTKGYVYECVSSGGETPVYSWIQVTGAKGDSGVYVGDTEPTNPDDNVWVDLSEGTEVLTADDIPTSTEGKSVQDALDAADERGLPTGGAIGQALVKSGLPDFVTEWASLMPDGTVSSNILINGGFSVNQRAVSGTVTLAAGAYGHDMWTAGDSGCTYTFSTSANVTTITITAGSLIQIVEGKDFYGGTVCLSWSGTAQGKIGSGSYSASGVTGTAVGGANLTIEFGTGTLANVQLNYGATALPFVLRRYADELRLCFRYARRGLLVSGLAHGPTILNITYPITPRMRDTPTISLDSLTFAPYGADNVTIGSPSYAAFALTNETIMYVIISNEAPFSVGRLYTFTVSLDAGL